MAHHGVTLAWTFDDLNNLERASVHRTLAPQGAAGKTLRIIDDVVCRATALQIAGERQQSELFFASIKRLLDRDLPEWRSTD